MKTGEITGEVSSHPVENGRWEPKKTAKRSGGKKKPRATEKTEGGAKKIMKKDLLICEAGRKARKRPTLVAGMKPNEKCQFICFYMHVLKLIPTRSLLRVFTTLWLGVFVVAVFTAHAGWQLVWSDEFNGSSLNTNVWWCISCPGTSINGNNELEVYSNSPANVQVTNGMLRLVGVNIGSGANYVLTSGRLMTMNIDDCTGNIISNMTPSFITVGGAIEWRAKLPQGTGLWPALWLMPREQYTGREDPVEGTWPNSGEIDVVENNGAEANQVAQNLHYYNGSFQSSESVSDVTQWHVYRLEWLTNQFNWYVDGVLGSTTTNWNAPPGYSYPAPFDANSGGFYIIMDFALGGFYTGNPSAADVAANLPAEMDIDYVRVYTLTTTIVSTNYFLTVINGTGSGSYTNGQVVSISTNAPGFAYWSADSNIADTNLASTTYTMGPSNDTVTAYYVTPVKPVLSASQTNGMFVISWTQQQATWVLEQTTTLNSSNSWEQVPATQYQTNNQNQVFFTVQPPLTNNMFYRLLQQ